MGSVEGVGSGEWESLFLLDSLLYPGGSVRMPWPDPREQPVAAEDGPGAAQRLSLVDVDLLLALHQAGAACQGRHERPDPMAPPLRWGDFSVVRELGQGRFGIVFEAIDADSHTIALKIARPTTLFTRSARSRFIREAELVKRVAHPGVVRVHRVGDHDGVLFIAMELCAGGNLATWLTRHPGPVAPHTAARLVRALALAVQGAHEAGVCHRDIKPENVMVGSSADVADGVKIVDFGLAKAFSGLDDRVSGSTASGVWLGTFEWMAPERLERRIGTPGPLSDIHALGLLLDRLLTGVCRSVGATTSETIDRRLREWDRSAWCVPGLPEGLLAITARCLRLRPEDRYPDGAALADDLRRWLGGMPLSTPAPPDPPQPPQRGWRFWS